MPISIGFNINQLIEQLKNDLIDLQIRNIIAIPLLNGAMQLTVDILKEFNTIEHKHNISHYIYPIIVKSYIKNKVKTTTEIIYFDVEDFLKTFNEIDDKLILIIDDIIDTGETIEYVYKYISTLIKTNDKYPQIRTLSLIWKSNKSCFEPDYYLIDDTNDRWWIGYGMDDNGKNRFTKGLYFLDPVEI